MNVSDLHIFKADIGLLNICMGFQDSWPERGCWGQNRGRDGAIVTPMNLFLLLGVLTSVPILVKSDQEMRL